MTDSTVSPRSSYLFARPRAMRGAERVYAFLGVYDSCNASPSPDEAGTLAVLQDWPAVEEDAQHVLGTRHILAPRPVRRSR